jgi:hypothetical protein
MTAALADEAHPAAAWLVVMHHKVPSHAGGEAGHAGHTFSTPVGHTVAHDARERVRHWVEHPRAAPAAAALHKLLLALVLLLLDVCRPPAGLIVLPALLLLLLVVLPVLVAAAAAMVPVIAAVAAAGTSPSALGSPVNTPWSHICRRCVGGTARVVLLLLLLLLMVVVVVLLLWCCPGGCTPACWGAHATLRV